MCQRREHFDFQFTPNSLNYLQVLKFSNVDNIVFIKLKFELVIFSGITYLRDFLHLPPEIVPATLRRQPRTETARPRPKGMP